MVRKLKSRIGAIAVAGLLAIGVLASGATPANAADSTVKISGAGTGVEFCLNHNASAVPCSTTTNRWLFTVADPARNSWRIVAATGTWSTCLERQVGTDHLRLATCAWNAGQIWVPSATNGYNQLVNDGTFLCMEMNRTNLIPNGVVTVTGCRNYDPQWWTWGRK